MKKSLKNSIVLLIILSMMTLLVSCEGSNDDGAITVGEASVGTDVYAYYLDEIMKKENTDLKEADAKKQAADKCAEYVKVNSEFLRLKLSLSSSAKAEIAVEVNDLWSMFAGYYEKIGVSKQTLTNVKTSEAYKTELVNAIFGVGGSKEISADAQKEYYNNNFVFFKAINAYLCTTDKDGNVISLPSEELTAISEKFSSLKAEITSDNTIDLVNKAYVEANGGSAETEMIVLSATSTTDAYPENFFKDVFAMSVGDISVLQYDSYIFLVQKVDSSSYYEDNAKSNLLDMAKEDFAKELDSRYSKQKVTSDEGEQTSVYNLITKMRKL